MNYHKSKPGQEYLGKESIKLNNGIKIVVLKLNKHDYTYLLFVLLLLFYYYCFIISY